MLKASDTELEVWHDWIQWAFPLPEGSRAVQNSPVAPASEFYDMRRNPVVLTNARALSDLYYKFLENTKSKWATAPDHNWLRISRVIRSLVFRGLQGESDRVYHLAIESTANLPTAQVNAWPHWNAAHNGFTL